MSRELAEQVAKAILYEGYLLYPYRPSAIKNRERFTFGGVYPRSYSEAQSGSDACAMQTECLVEGGPEARLEVSARFLHLRAREVYELEAPLWTLPEVGRPPARRVETLRVGDRVYHNWQEAVEREVTHCIPSLGRLAEQSQCLNFTFPGQHRSLPLRNAAEQIVGLLDRDQRSICGQMTASAEVAGPGLFKLTVQVENLTPVEGGQSLARDEALLSTFVSTHAILQVHDGAFVSLLDPPEALREAAAGCRNEGAWPVLVGEAGARGLLLSSPIILYDYPEIAPESAGDFFDGTEIDEMLVLRVLTLTDDEKREIREADERGREMLERTETLPPEVMQRLHGALRGLRPAAS